MQQGAAGGGGGSGQQYAVPVPGPSDVAQFGGGSGRPPHGHMLGISSHDQTAQHLQQHQQHLLQQSSHKAESLNEISQTAAAPPAAQRSAGSFDQFMPGGGGGGGFGEEEGLHGDDGERGGPVGNRWPRQETLALLKIRSEMDATFRDASLKGPLWEDVSRRLAELGYNRSAKKCKEKFENVHKYYKRTKDGRAGRQDGKSYRFFSQLEALQGSNSNNNHGSPTSNANDARNNHNNTLAMSSIPAPNRLIPQPCSAPVMLSTNITAAEMNRNIISAAAATNTTTNPVAHVRQSSDFSGGNLSFSSDSSEEDDDYDEQTDSRKRKRGAASCGPSASTKNMMLFFEQLMKQVMERQEMMQQKFLETIEKREQDRMVLEEAWKRQEMARLNREHEIMAQERALSASRDAAFISFLQKITGQSFQGIPTMAPLAQSTTTINPVPVTYKSHEQQHHRDNNNNNNSNNNSQNNNSQENAAGAGGIGAMSAEQMDITFDPSSSRWPKPEVHALIRLRSGMEPRYQDAGPKGPLWEEISAGMARLGYNRSAKRCKEKWENINKYFKKVKESNKKRPEDAKTCPYFHQLDQLYRKRILGNTSSIAIKEDQQMIETADKEGGHILAIMPPPGPSSDAKNNGTATAPGAAIATTNGTAFYSSPETRTGADHHRPLKKTGEGLVMDVMDMDDDDEDDEDDNMQSGHQQQQQQREQQSIVEDYDDDKIEADDSDNNNEHDPQHQNVTTTGTSTAHNNHLPFAHFVQDARTAASAPANSFMAMVHRLSATSDQPEFKTSKA